MDPGLVEARYSGKEIYDNRVPERGSGTYPQDSSFRDKQWVSGVVGLRRRRFASDVRKTWAFSLFIVAFIAMAVTCLRRVRAPTLSGRPGRRLAERLPDDEATRAAILEMCLDMEEQAGLIQQASTPLADPRTGISGILQSLTSYSEGPSQSAAPPRQSGGLPPFAPLESPAPFFTPQPFPSTSGATSEAAERGEQWHAAGQQKEAAMQAGRERALGTQEPYEPAAPVKAAKLQQLPEHPQPKKHTSGWKRRGPLQAPRVSSPPSEHQPHDEPLVALSQAVQMTLSPDPLVFGGWQSEEQQEGGHEAEEEDKDDPLLRAMEAVSEEVYIPELELPSLAEGLPAATKAAPSSSYAFEVSAVPSTSQAFAFTPASQTEGPLPGPLRSASAAAPPPSFPSLQPPSAPPLPGPAPPMPPHTHLFYRLPVLLPGVTSKKFSFERAVAVSSKWYHQHLLSARELLAKSEITQPEASYLIADTEALVGHLLRAHREPVANARPSRAFQQLAYRYLIMEVIFCAIQVLGPQMGAVSWWPQFTSMIPSAYSYTPDLVTHAKAYENAVLGKQLSLALASLKRGVRPGLEETVRLKRALLCSDSSYSAFKDKKWEPWRQADSFSRGASSD